MFRFQKLDVWQRSASFASVVYRVTRQFPSDERFGLTSQMRRSAVSVAANIAEGSGRSSDQEFMRFLDIAYGSLMETLSHATIACNQGFPGSELRDDLFSAADEIARMLSSLAKKTSH